jgi:hypothetical protein
VAEPGILTRLDLEEIVAMPGRELRLSSLATPGRSLYCAPTDVIGAAGFEPATSAPQTRRSNQAELRPVHEGMYGLRGRPWAYAAFDRSTAS